MKMANCSYARCVQERRLIKRELQKWTRSMVYIVGLERVAEELMGRRKWALYQDNLSIYIRRQAVQTENTDSLSDILLVDQKNATVQPHGFTEGSETPKSNTDSSSNISREEDKIENIVDNSMVTSSHCPILNTNCRQQPFSVHSIDWNPKEKCYLCDHGKLLTLNERGELVAEGGPDRAESELVIASDSDSDSSDTAPILSRGNGQKHSLSADRSKNSKMTSLESVVAAVASMHGLPAVAGLTSLYPGLWYPFGSMQVEGDSSGSTNGKGANSSSSNGEDATVGGTVEQPLDLSAKAMASSSLDQKNVFKAKPRMTTISGRRTYTEEELQSALQDILSGKLGTRRAAVLYGIPRSTLRNKVYKLAIEHKREANMTAVPPALADLDDDDKDGSGAEEEKETERNSSCLPLEEVFRVADSHSECAFDKAEESPGSFETSAELCGHIPSSSPTPNNNVENPNLGINIMDPNIILQGLLIGGALSGLTGNKALENLGMLPEFLRNILLHNELLKGTDGLHSKPDTPETTSICSTGRSGSENNENLNQDDTFLKVPSYKSVRADQALLAGTDALGFLKTNGDTCGIHSSTSAPNPANMNNQPKILDESGPRDAESPLLQRISSVSLREVIAQSISKTMQPPIQHEKHDNLMLSSQAGNSHLIDQYKWPTISVKKGLGAEVNRFGGLPASSPHLHSSIPSISAQMNNSTGTGGKGTRPKRGKYRNYDRDSLVEAVKAVQRGEMSVHRAGSYYGVPHSTLEYKVKERHLMRPRKREPKPQPVDDRSPPCNLSTTPIKLSENAPSIRNNLDKSKNMSVSKSPLSNPAFNTVSPNGLKGSPFLETSVGSPSVPYSPHLFWQQPPNFPGMSLEFSRAAAAAAAAAVAPPSTSSFPSSEGYFGTSMRQRFQDHIGSADAGTSSNSNGTGSGNGSTNNSKPNTPNSSVPCKIKKGGLKTSRNFAESIYDGASGNGLLDGIIRHSLDRKLSDPDSLLDQLKSSILLRKATDSININRKRGSDSPTIAVGLDIKKERITEDEDDIGQSDARESESYLKLHSGKGGNQRTDLILTEDEGLAGNHSGIKNVPVSPKNNRQSANVISSETDHEGNMDIS